MFDVNETSINLGDYVEISTTLRDRYPFPVAKIIDFNVDAETIYVRFLGKFRRSIELSPIQCRVLLPEEITMVLLKR